MGITVVESAADLTLGLKCESGDEPMVVVTFTGVIGWSIGFLALGLVLMLLGSRSLSELRI
jgi:hypothetical protein